MKMPELLAPVGGKPHLKAAVNSGADAVYMGGLAFNARIFADNFRDDELPEAIEFAHLRGVKVYITLNTLLRDSELARALEYADYLYSIGVDGLIVQDMGLVRLLHKYLPDFPIHFSTQGTLYNKEAMTLAREMGFSRVVPARELSLREITELVEAGKAAPGKDEKDIAVEVFVHGAMCMCYSGQCQMSRMIGRSRKVTAAGSFSDINKDNTGSCRSGNRGTCAQPCRQAYTDENGHTYYALSPKDMCQIENLPDLILSGAASFKIEGRMKTPEYVATVTGIYRKYIDRFDRLCREFGPEEAKARYTVDEQDMLRLKQVFNRGNFTDGYLYGNPGEKLLSGHSPKNQGIYAGRVVAVIDSEDKAADSDERKAVRGALRRGKVLVCVALSRSFASDIENGDGLEFRAEDEDVPREAIGSVATYIKYIDSHEVIVGDFDRGVQTGDLAFKVRDSRLADEALSIPDKKLPVTMVFTAREGQFPHLAMTDVRSGFTAEISADHVIERAKKVATDASRVEDSLSRLGDTAFSAGLTGIDVQIDDDIMIPVSIVNRMRREAADELTAERREKVIRDRKPLSRAELDVIESGEMLGAVKLDMEAYREKIASGEFRPVPLERFMEIYESEGGDKTSSLHDLARKVFVRPKDDQDKTWTNYLPFILNVSKGALDSYIRDNFDEIVRAVRNTGILIGNPGWISQFRAAGVKVYGDYGLNVYNEQARKAYEEAGVELYMPSHESGIADARGIPLMITEHPVAASSLTDRKGEVHRVETAPSKDKTLIY